MRRSCASQRWRLLFIVLLACAVTGATPSPSSASSLAEQMTPEQRMEMAVCNLCLDVKTGLRHDALHTPLGTTVKSTYKRKSKQDETRRSLYAWADEIVTDACRKLGSEHLRPPRGAVCVERGADYCGKAKPLAASLCPMIVSDDEADERSWIEYVLAQRNADETAAADPCAKRCKLQNKIQQAVTDAQENMQREMRDSMKLGVWDQLTLVAQELTKSAVWVEALTLLWSYRWTFAGCVFAVIALRLILVIVRLKSSQHRKSPPVAATKRSDKKHA